MCDFLGTKITKHEIDDAKKELSKKRKHFDDYDVYVYYKSLLELERYKERKKAKVDEDEEFQPCNYISSIYKRKEIKKKTLYDYIDKSDNIYEDIITDHNFQEEKNYTDDITFTFFNESLSYTLLRNNNYVDGIPIGINIKEKKNIIQNKCINNDGKNGSCSYSSTCNKSTLTCLNEEHKSTNLKVESNNKKCEQETYKIKYENKNRNLIKKDMENTGKEIGPKLPEIFEEVRKSIGKEVFYFNKNYERYENEYVHILSYRNNMIYIKMKEQKEYEKQIQKIYKPKNNFEGAFFDEYKDNTKNMKTTSDLFYRNFLENEKENIMIKHLNKYSSDYSSNEMKQQKFERIHDYSYIDNYSEDDIYSKDKELYENYVREIEKVKNNNNLFVLYVPRLHKQEIYTYANFYDSFYKNNEKNMDNNSTDFRTVKDLYLQYYKLINLNNKEQINKYELLNLYMPKKKWVHFSNYENVSNSRNKIYDLKREVSFDNDIKKKNRFILFCKIKENNIKNKNIFNIKECEEFNELMNQLKIYDLDFYTKEIINEDLHTNFQTHTYNFSKYIYEKLQISNVHNKNEESKETTPKIYDFFLKIPHFIFETIFYS